MAQSANSSDSLALSRRPRNSRERWAAPVEYTDSRVLPKAVSGHRTLGTASVVPRPVKPAEVAQARVFEGLLQAECAELHELAHRMPGAVDQQRDNDSPSPTWDLMQIRARIDEVQRLLQALRGRFPHTVPESDRSSV
jgi:hypothetical protein